MRRLVLATRNPGKLREIVHLLTGLPVEVVSLADYPQAPEADEPFDTFAENAAQKAVLTAQATGEWAFADDSGLEVDALGGAPGVKSSRVAESDPERVAWLLQQLSAVPAERRTARFVCAVVLAGPGGVLGQWQATAEGTITAEPRGDQGFGYDPVFWYAPLAATFAALSGESKSEVSHRGKALRAFRADLPGLLG